MTGALMTWRSVLLIATIAFSSSAPAESEGKKDGGADAPFVFERFEAVELSQKHIVAHTAAFIAERFVSSKSVMQLKDPELGKIVGDIVLMNANAGFFDAFKGIKTRVVLDAKDGRYRLRATNVEGIDGNGVVPAWGKLKGPNRYRIEPMAQGLLTGFADDLLAYLKKAKADGNW
jgi:hypothetical protein